jgi:hypothetical protein
MFRVGEGWGEGDKSGLILGPHPNPLPRSEFSITKVPFAVEGTDRAKFKHKFLNLVPFGQDPTYI